MTFLLDTNICVAYLNETESGLADRLRERSPDQLKLCSVVKAELLYGARASQRVAENLTPLGRFFEMFESLPFDDAAAEQYGVIRAQLKHQGKPIGANDLMIAAIALAGEVTLVTRNSDEFRRVAGLRVESW